MEETILTPAEKMGRVMDRLREENARLEERNLHNVTAYSQELTQRTTELQRTKAEVRRLEGLILALAADERGLVTAEVHAEADRIRAQRKEDM